MNGGEAVVEALRLAGVTHVFGLLGSSTMEVYDALYDCKDIRLRGGSRRALPGAGEQPDRMTKTAPFRRQAGSYTIIRPT